MSDLTSSRKHEVAKVRIIAGSAKGRILATPAGVTRPTSDRTREGIFSALESEIGTCAGISFLDLFAGTGAVGLEALSRGAAEVLAVEKDVKAANVCRDNYDVVKSETSGKFSVLRMSVDTFLEMEGEKLSKFDVAYLDPPYELANSSVEKVLEKLQVKNLLKPNSVVVVERATRSQPFTWPEALNPLKVRKYGEGTAYFAIFEFR